MTDSDNARGAPRRWRGQEPEDRRAARRAQLIDAGLELMGTQGAPATTMRATCRQAGLTERYFYESFENRDALLIAVLDEVVLGARDVLVSSLANAPEDPALLIRHVVSAFTSYVAKDRRRGRIMFVESHSVPELWHRGEQLIDEFTVPISASLEMMRGEGDPPDRITTELNSIGLFGALAFVYQRWLTGSSRITSERIVEHISQVIEAHVNVDSSPKAPPVSG